MNVVTGIGWITQREYGCLRRGVRSPYSDLRALRTDLEGQAVFTRPVKGFGRYDRVSQMTCCVTALAFHDAGMSYGDRKQDIGILGSNAEGCLQSNLDYFKDFVSHGRTLARANYFIYTLPSSPMAEAAIHFKCQGPLLYMRFPGKPVVSLLRHADRMILRGESSGILAILASEEAGQCFMVGRRDDASGEDVFEIESVIDIAQKEPPLGGLIAALTDLKHDGTAGGEPRAGGSRGRRP